MKTTCIRCNPRLIAALTCGAALFSFLAYKVVFGVDYELRSILPDDFRGQFFLIEDSKAGIPLDRRGVNVIRIKSSDSIILVRDMWPLEHWHSETFLEQSGKEIKSDNTPEEGPKAAWGLRSHEIVCCIIGTYKDYIKHEKQFREKRS